MEDYKNQQRVSNAAIKIYEKYNDGKYKEIVLFKKGIFNALSDCYKKLSIEKEIIQCEQLPMSLLTTYTNHTYFFLNNITDKINDCLAHDQKKDNGTLDTRIQSCIQNKHIEQYFADQMSILISKQNKLLEKYKLI